MEWQTLFTNKRLGAEDKALEEKDPVRNAYLRDYDRLIFSSAFRRLQNKTQVFPLPGHIFVHNRLTHSLEVASVGRSLGQAVGYEIFRKHENSLDQSASEFYRYELSSVIATACLAHDIGNPPFGHSGEDAIRHFFSNLTGDVRKRLEQEVSPNQLNDFKKFEGNANAFRTLTHNFNERSKGGYRLTYTSLASIIKYPSDSTSGFDQGQNILSTKKSGFFDSEINTYEKIAKELGIKKLDPYHNIYARHPFVFLVEAADDICYRVIDLEDAHRLKIVSLKEVTDLLGSFFSEEKEHDSWDKILPVYNQINDDNQKLQYLRARLINLLISRCVEAFMENEQELLTGNLNKSLVKLTGDHIVSCLKEIDTVSKKKIYNYKSVVEVEIAGYNVIGGLLKEYLDAILHQNIRKSEKLLELMSKQYVVDSTQSLYENIQAIVDFIAGMSDPFAVDLYRKITGISIPYPK